MDCSPRDRSSITLRAVRVRLIEEADRAAVAALEDPATGLIVGPEGWMALAERPHLVAAPAAILQRGLAARWTSGRHQQPTLRNHIITLPTMRPNVNDITLTTNWPSVTAMC
jgi:hypothetical protein